MSQCETNKQKMLAGKLYIAGDPELQADMARAKRLTRLFNATAENEMEKRTEILKELFGSAGENIYIEPTFRCDYGSNISIGNDFYANYDCIMIDVANITIGNNVFFAPRVCVFTAGHPIDAPIRDELLEFGKPIKIGDSVWIGGNTVINPGVTIGSNVVIGSGSVVTRDIPDNVVAVGNPCRVLRPITEEDKKFWEAQRVEYYETIVSRQ